MQSETRYSAGWDDARVQRVLEHYGSHTDDDAVAEDEATGEITSLSVTGAAGAGGCSRRSR